jgi:hypothetical protein
MLHAASQAARPTVGASLQPLPRSAACFAAASRRDALSLALLGATAAVLPYAPPALAARVRVKPPPEEDYLTLPVRTHPAARARARGRGGGAADVLPSLRHSLGAARSTSGCALRTLWLAKAKK